MRRKFLDGHAIALCNMTSPIETAIFEALAAKPGKSISPEDIAKGLEPERWQRALGQVRSTAIGLARAGRLTILRHNKRADPDIFKGVWRMRLPRPEDSGEG